MKEITKQVSHQQARQLLHNKFVVVLGDSIQRAVYKDIVLLLQKDSYLTVKQLKSKGEMSFEQDCLVEGGCLSQMHNGTAYREVRQFRSAHHLVRFYFVTRIYSRYMMSILEDFHSGLKPDIVIVNSCIWDISRYLSMWVDDYQENLQKFFVELKSVLPEEALVIWNLTMPLGEKIKGGFLLPEIAHKVSQLRHDVIVANFYSGSLADSYGLDVLDLHFQFRFSLQHRTKDGVHWNAIAHRRITCLLLQHSAQAWGVVIPHPPTAVAEKENCSDPKHPPSKENCNHNRKESIKDTLFLDSLNYIPQSQKCHHVTAGDAHPTVHRKNHHHRHVKNGFNYRLLYHFEPYQEHHFLHYHHHFVMRNRQNRYTPYSHNPGQRRQYYYNYY